MRNAMRERPRYSPAAPGQHTDWCAGDHRCGLGEHRSEPITARTDRHSGHVVGTRVQTATGSHWLELSINVPLPGLTEQDRARYAHKVMNALAMTLGRIFYTRGAAR